MTYELTSPPLELKNRFYALKGPGDIAALLDVAYSDFNYWIYRTPGTKRHTSFEIS